MDHIHWNVGDAYRSSSQTQKKAERVWKELSVELWEVIALRKYLQAKEEKQQYPQSQYHPVSQKTAGAEQSSTDPLRLRPVRTTSVYSGVERWRQEDLFFQRQALSFQLQQFQPKPYVDDKHEAFENAVRPISKTSNGVDF